MNDIFMQCKNCDTYIFTSDQLNGLCYECYKERFENNMLKIKLRDKTTGKEFEKEFETEFERDKFIRKLRYSKKLILVNSYINDLYN